jgi:hypothetical protein
MEVLQVRTKRGKNVTGCYADGSFGHDHVREVLAHQVESDGCIDRALIEALLGPMSDDAQEEYDAIAWLNENACIDGVYFTLNDGDLLLVEEGFDQ